MTRALQAPAAIARSSTASVGAYLHDSELPLTSLVFVLPLMVIYEVGTSFLTTAARRGGRHRFVSLAGWRESLQDRPCWRLATRLLRRLLRQQRDWECKHAEKCDTAEKSGHSISRPQESMRRIIARRRGEL